MIKKTILLIFISIIITVVVTPVSDAKYIIDKTIIAANLNIDRTVPVGVVNYFPQEKSNNAVLVTVSLSEPINEVEGWNLSENKLILTKNYEQRTIEKVTIIDLSGNKGTVEISVQNINL